MTKKDLKELEDRAYKLYRLLELGQFDHPSW